MYRLRYFGFNIVQHDDCSIKIDGDDKLEAIEASPISRLRRKNGDDMLNAVEKSAFSSLKSSLGWLGTTVSPFCSATSSSLQQRLPAVKVSDLTKQTAERRELKKLGTVVHYSRPMDQRQYSLTVVVFSDAERPTENAQLSHVAGLLIGQLEEGSVYHTISWQSQKSRHPVRSIAAGEILAAGEAIDEGLVLKRTFALLLDMEIELVVVLDSKDLYSSLATQRKSIERSVRADVNFIQYQFETKQANRICWIPGRLNLADPGTKPDSPLVAALQLLLFSGRLPFGFPEMESACAIDKPLGLHVNY